MQNKHDLDAQSASLFEQMSKHSSVDVAHLTEAEKVKIERDGYARTIPAAGKPEGVYTIVDKVINAQHGQVPLRIYYPNEKKGQPVLVYFHGGGFIAGGFETHEQMMHYLTNHAGVIIVSVGYRLAPENKYPVAIDDAFEALKWIKENAAGLKVNPDKIALGGDSAGGTISAIMALKVRETASLKITFQLLFDPAMDLTMSSNSWKTLGDKGYVLTTHKVKQFYDWYLPAGIDRKDPLVSPLFAADFKKLPPTFIITASADPLKDEGKIYAQKLADAGVQIEHKEYVGVMHGFYQMSAIFDKGKTALKDAASALANAMHQ